MKRTAITAIALTVLLCMGLGVYASPALSVTVREDCFNDEAVSFIRRHPRIYGLTDGKIAQRINLLLFEEGNREYLRVRCAAMAGNDRATGETVVTRTCNFKNPLCMRYQTTAAGSTGKRYDNIRYVCIDTDSGLRLRFWDLFVKDGADRESVLQIFERYAVGCGEPDTEWVLNRLENIGSMPFFIDGENGLLTVILCDKEGRSAQISVPLSEFELDIAPQFRAITMSGKAAE